MLAEIIIFTFFGLWFILSVVFQFNTSIKTGMARLDIFGLLPSWSFFAPTPGTSDYRLAYRDCRKDGNWSFWKEVNVYKEHSPFRFIWNPSKVETKALSDIVQILFKELNSEVYKKCPEVIVITNPYLALLQKVVSEPKEEETLQRQFAILSSSGYDGKRKIQPLFISCTHKIA
jgi:hypothetical protein